MDVKIDKTARIKHTPSLGNHVSIDMCVYCSVYLHTGSWVHIAPHVSIIGGIKSTLILGDFAGISTGARIVCGSEDFVNSLLGFMPEEFKTDIYGYNVIDDYAWAGVGSIVLPNIKMAIGSVLGAGGVLTHDTEPWTVYVGVPARPVKLRNKELILENAYKLRHGIKKG
jgi:galactoside O-acetyltransferase